MASCSAWTAFARQATSGPASRAGRASLSGRRLPRGSGTRRGRVGLVGPRPFAGTIHRDPGVLNELLDVFVRAAVDLGSNAVEPRLKFTGKVDFHSIRVAYILAQK